jgi:hypothetical protein
MPDIVVDEMTFSKDIAVGEIVDAEIKIEGKRTRVIVAARVVVNNEDMVQLSLSDVPRAIREKNGEAVRKLMALLDAGLN